MASALRDDLVLMGFVGKPHGVRGDVKVVPETDDPSRFESLSRIFLDRGGSIDEVHVEAVRLQSSARGVTPVLTLEGVQGREGADALRGLRVFAAEEDLPLEEDEFFLADLVGLRVASEEGDDLGRVTDVVSLPAGPVLVIARESLPDAMVPAVPEFVVDISDEKLVIRVIEGLLDT